MLLISCLTALGMAGACAGVLLSQQIKRIHHLMSITGGLFLGMATFLVLPEAFRSGPWPIVSGFLVLGCMTFAWVERLVHRSLRGKAGISGLPLPTIFAVVALHNALDGWNMGIALQMSPGNFATAFSIGMGLHKGVGGLAIGLMLRNQRASVGRNLLVAATAEAITLVGAAAERAFVAEMGQQWTVWFLAATGGSFLFLAFHALAEARRGTTWHQTLSFGAIGFAVVGTAALLHP